MKFYQPTVKVRKKNTIMQLLIITTSILITILAFLYFFYCFRNLSTTVNNNYKYGYFNFYEKWHTYVILLHLKTTLAIICLKATSTQIPKKSGTLLPRFKKL